MAEFKLHCFAASGNSYKVALFLALADADWEAVVVDYFGGETRAEAWRDKLNEMGEIPVLEHKGLKISQSGVILDYLAEVTGQFGARNDDEKRDIWRWILFDNHKFTSYYATLRFMVGLQKTGDTAVTQFLRDRATGAYRIVDSTWPAINSWWAAARPSPTCRWPAMSTCRRKPASTWASFPISQPGRSACANLRAGAIHTT